MDKLLRADIEFLENELENAADTDVLYVYEGEVGRLGHINYFITSDKDEDDILYTYSPEEIEGATPILILRKGDKL